jgi:threonine synthase
VARPVALACIRCGARHPLEAFSRDCDRCRATAPSNLTVVYAEAPTLTPAAVTAGPPTLWRYDEALPLPRAAAVSLGEGSTPLLPAPRVGAGLGLADLYIKDESRNPTWSFKDRLATVAVSWARQVGARVIATSSSGNAGAAAAAYAARAGLPCVVLTFAGAAGPMVAQMRAYGAFVLAVKDKADRWPLLAAGVRRRGWFPTSPFLAPAVGSNPLGLEGYKTLAFEIAEQLGWRAPDWCALPVCYGDALFGVWKGFDELARQGLVRGRPRLIAAEIHGSLGRALAEGRDDVPDMPKTHESIAASIGATRSTYQALHALRASGGTAVTVDDADLLAWQAKLANAEGVWIETSSAAALAGVARLRERGTIARDATVVVVATAGGLKDATPAVERQGDVPLIAPTLDAALDALARVYGGAV